MERVRDVGRWIVRLPRTGSGMGEVGKIRRAKGAVDTSMHISDGTGLEDGVARDRLSRAFLGWAKVVLFFVC